MSTDTPDDAWWEHITLNAMNWFDSQLALYGASQNWDGLGCSEDQERRQRQMNKAHEEYKRWILRAWDKHRVWMDEQGRVFGKDYVLPNEVERLLK